MPKLNRIYILVVFIFLNNLVFANGNTEFRGIWVITWEHINAYSSVEQNKANVRTILDNIQKANMNAVLWQVRQSGTAYYNSSYEPWGYYAGHDGERYIDPGYDPLAYAIQEAHKRGIELHAWFNVFQVASTHEDAPAMKHPNWVCTNRDGKFMTSHLAFSPGLDSVRAYTIQVAMEIVRNYDIDGLHLDYVRWNEYDEDDMLNPPSELEQIRQMDGMIPEEKLNKLAKTFGTKRYIYDVEHPYSAGVPEGFDTWDDWRRWGVTEFVRQLHDSIQTVKPWVRLSPAALGKYNWSGWNGYYIVFQDAALWFNEGYIDQLTPMHYHWTTGDEFYGMLKQDCPNCWQDWIDTGINEGRMYTVGPGSYVLDDYNVWSNHEQIVKRSREVPWVDGFQFFSYGSWKNHIYWETAAEKFFTEKTKIKPLTYMNTEQPDGPVLELLKEDSLTYRITVTPPAGTEAPMWFALYRSTQENPDSSQDQLIARLYGDTVFTVTDHFNGLQDYNGKYRYYATALSRYWIESQPSNVEISDNIPSFAPTVVATSPGPGEKIPVTDPIIFTFSKTMDTSSVNGAVHVSPQANIEEFQWDKSLKELTIVFAQPLDFETEYTVKLDSVIKDVNGRMLDGNGDGTEGDSYVFHFMTLPEDFYPPVIVGSYPPLDSLFGGFDVAGTASIWFNEELDESTLSAENINLFSGSQAVEMEYFHYVVDDRSILSVQAAEDLAPDADYQIILRTDIADTIGNPLPEELVVNFHTSKEHYVEKTMIDDFTLPGAWWQPTGSGSTHGVVGGDTKWGYTQKVYLPAPHFHKAAYLKYHWQYDPSNPGYLIREYLPYTDKKNVEFDTTYVLQVYLYGDSSNNTFRFCIDEKHGSSWSDHEVSQWITIDWKGWRLVEWKLSDPNSVGSWISPDNQLNGNKYRIDSFQFGHDDSTGAVTGTLYLDDFRVVKKSSEPVTISAAGNRLPNSYHLEQNYPNPFNPATTIAFQIPEPGRVKLTVYNILGAQVAELINKELMPGSYKAVFDGSRMASGTYIYRLTVNGRTFTRKMLLLK